jgi:hypothetical protein
MRLLDRWLVERESALLARGDGVVVDVGIGTDPWTAIELQRVVRVKVIATDIDVDRVLHARNQGVDARLGEFTTRIVEPALVVRAMNVLRGYTEEEIDAGHRALATPLVDGGIVLEGTSDATGAVVTAWLLRRVGGDLVRERLLLLTDFSRGFGPGLFWDHLPRDLRRSAERGTRIRAFLDEWNRAFEQARATGAQSPEVAFRVSIERLGPEIALVGPGFAELSWSHTVSEPPR